MKMTPWLLLFLAIPRMTAGNPAEPPPAPGQVDFAKEVRPILDRCQPCHFKGGSVYGRYPFDMPGTVHRLGERLFTRIKGEKDQTVIRAFLAQGQ
jgi:hypothetical protein